MEKTFTWLTLCCLTLATVIALSDFAAVKDQSYSWIEVGAL